jgi:hypothetical protein
MVQTIEALPSMQALEQAAEAESLYKAFGKGVNPFIGAGKRLAEATKAADAASAVTRDVEAKAAVSDAERARKAAFETYEADVARYREMTATRDIRKSQLDTMDDEIAKNSEAHHRLERFRIWRTQPCNQERQQEFRLGGVPPQGHYLYALTSQERAAIVLADKQQLERQSLFSLFVSSRDMVAMLEAAHPEFAEAKFDA